MDVTHAVQACRCIDALVTMGVLVPGGDRTAVRRTAEFFLKNFEVNCLSQSLPADLPAHVCDLRCTVRYKHKCHMSPESFASPATLLP